MESDHIWAVSAAEHLLWPDPQVWVNEDRQSGQRPSGAVHCTIKLRSAVRGPSLDFATWPNKLRKHNGLVREPSSSFSAHLGNLVCHIGFSISAGGEFVDILSYPECSWHFLTRILPASFSDLSPGVKLSIEFVWSSNNSDNEEKGKNGQLDSPQSLYYSFLRNQPIMSQPSWIGSRWLCVSKRFSAVSISYCWVK